MTTPFHYADLKTGAGRPAHRSSEAREKPASVHRSNASFPALAFDRPGSAADAADEITYSAEDLKAAVEEARRTTAVEVEATTRAALAAELDHRQVEALEAVRAQLGAGEEHFVRWVSDVAGLVQSLAGLMGQALGTKALALQPLADIEDMVCQSLRHLVDQPSIELRLTADLVDRASDLVSTCAVEAGFRGEVAAVADPTLVAGEAKLVWKNGVVHRDPRRIQAEVDGIIDAWFGHQTTYPCLQRAEIAADPDRDHADVATDRAETALHSSKERPTS